MSTFAAASLATQFAVVAGGTAAATTVATAVQTKKAGTKTRRAERKARQIENAVGRQENARAIRQRIAKSRVEQAELIQGAEAGGVAGSSSLLASVSSSQSTTAGDIGSAITRQAGSAGAANVRSAGARSASGNLNKAANFGAIGSVSSLFTNSENNAKFFG